MRTRRRLLLLAATFAAIIVSCDRSELPTDASSPSNLAALAAAQVTAERGCARINVTLHGHVLDNVTLTETTAGDCGSGLELALGEVPELDSQRQVVRLPLVLKNNATHSFARSVRLYGWEDSLSVVSPPGLAGNKHTAEYLEFVNADSGIGPAEPAFAGATVWRFDSLLAPAGQPQLLPPGATSLVAWVEIAVKQGVHAFTLSLEAEAQSASGLAAPIIFLVDSGVAGGPRQDTMALVGEAVTYEFAPAAGYENIHVRIDGLPASPVGALTADTLGHMLTVTADRILVVPPRAAVLYAAAKAVLTASDVPGAYQAYLDAAYDYVQSSSDPSLASQDINDVNALAFDFLRDEVALRRIDAALAGYSFRVGPDALGDPGGTPIFDPSDTAVVATYRSSRAHGLLYTAEAASADTIEPTVVEYVNGVRTLLTNVVSTVQGSLTPLVRSIPAFTSGNIAIRWFYNRTWSEQPPSDDQHRIDCIRFYGARLSGGTIGGNAFGDYLAECMRDSTLRHISDWDFAEAARQVYSILANTDAQEADAARLGNDIQRYRLAGRHVILVPHSQGNLMANQAIHFLQQQRRYSPTADSACIGVVSLASPVSARWDVPEHYLAPVVVDGDLVPLTGGNLWPRTSTVLSRMVEDQAARLDALQIGSGAWYRIRQGFSTLHDVNNSYLKYEAADAVVAGLEQVYGACTVHDMVMLEPSVSATTGLRAFATVKFENAFGDPIARSLRPEEWSSADSSIVMPIGAGGGTGIFRALTPGITTVTAVRGARSATAVVTVTDPNSPPPELVGQWSGTWYDSLEPDEFGTVQVKISGTGFYDPSRGIYDFAVEMSWTDQLGQTWRGMSDNGPPHVINDDPGTSSSAKFWVYFAAPSHPNGPFFERLFNLTTHAGSDTIEGNSSPGDGSSGGRWEIQLSRVIQ